MAKKVAGKSAKVPSWLDREYPFEWANCGACLTQHRGGGCCIDPDIGSSKSRQKGNGPASEQ